MMNRRQLFGGAALFLTVPAIAQTDRSPAAPTILSTAAPAPAEVLGLGDAEKQHVAQMMLVGTLSLEASKLALPKTQNAKVKQFAQLEMAEQGTVADVLRSIKAAAGDLAPPPQLNSEAQEVLKRLQHSQKSSFDRDYVQAGITAHHDLLKIQEDYLSVGKNQVNVSVAQLVSAIIKEHLVLLHDLEGVG
jgi:putative membrane protein